MRATLSRTALVVAVEARKLLTRWRSVAIENLGRANGALSARGVVDRQSVRARFSLALAALLTALGNCSQQSFPTGSVMVTGQVNAQVSTGNWPIMIRCTRPRFLRAGADHARSQR